MHPREKLRQELLHLYRSTNNLLSKNYKFKTIAANAEIMHSVWKQTIKFPDINWKYCMGITWLVVSIYPTECQAYIYQHHHFQGLPLPALVLLTPTIHSSSLLLPVTKSTSLSSVAQTKDAFKIVERKIAKILSSFSKRINQPFACFKMSNELLNGQLKKYKSLTMKLVVGRTSSSLLLSAQKFGYSTDIVFAQHNRKYQHWSTLENFSGFVEEQHMEECTC